MHGYNNQFILFKWNRAISQINREKNNGFPPKTLNYQSAGHNAGILQTFEHVWLNAV